MSLDIRLPIGIFFSLTGAILSLHGWLESPSQYQKSLGVNLNLWWGLVLIAFGVVMLVLGRRGARGAEDAGESRQGGEIRGKK